MSTQVQIDAARFHHLQEQIDCSISHYAALCRLLHMDDYDNQLPLFDELDATRERISELHRKLLEEAAGLSWDDYLTRHIPF